MSESKYQYTDDMGEISGFGGGYESACRAMVIAGLEWLDAHPNAEPKFHSYEGVYGICAEDNQDAKDLTEAMLKPSNGDCTGAMHQATVSRVLWIHSHSWEEYCEKCRQSEKEEARP